MFCYTPLSPELVGTMAEWYYVDDATNAQQGPCTVQQLGELFAASSVTDSTLFWKDGQPDWSSLSSLSSLRAQVVASRGGPPALPTKTLPPVPAKPSTYGGGGGGGGAFAQAQASGAVVQSMSGEDTSIPHTSDYCSERERARGGGERDIWGGGRGVVVA